MSDISGKAPLPMPAVDNREHFSKTEIPSSSSSTILTTSSSLTRRILPSSTSLKGVERYSFLDQDPQLMSQSGQKLAHMDFRKTDNKGLLTTNEQRPFRDSKTAPPRLIVKKKILPSSSSIINTSNHINHSAHNETYHVKHNNSERTWSIPPHPARYRSSSSSSLFSQQHEEQQPSQLGSSDHFKPDQMISRHYSEHHAPYSDKNRTTTIHDMHLLPFTEVDRGIIANRNQEEEERSRRKTCCSHDDTIKTSKQRHQETIERDSSSNSRRRRRRNKEDHLVEEEMDSLTLEIPPPSPTAAAGLDGGGQQQQQGETRRARSSVSFKGLLRGDEKALQLSATPTTGNSLHVDIPFTDGEDAEAEEEEELRSLQNPVEEEARRSSTNNNNKPGARRLRELSVENRRELQSILRELQQDLGLLQEEEEEAESSYSVEMLHLRQKLTDAKNVGSESGMQQKKQPTCGSEKALYLGPSALRTQILQDFHLKLNPKEIGLLLQHFSLPEHKAQVNYLQVLDFLLSEAVVVDRTTITTGAEREELVLSFPGGGTMKKKKEKSVLQEEAARAELGPRMPKDRASRVLLEKMANLAGEINRHALSDKRYRKDPPHGQSLLLPLKQFKEKLWRDLGIEFNAEECQLLKKWFPGRKAEEIDLNLFLQQFWALGSAAKIRRRKEEAQQSFVEAVLARS